MIKLVKEYILELSTVPFSEREDEVAFVSSSIDSKLESFISANLEKIKDIFEDELLHFVYKSGTVSPDQGIEPSCVISKKLNPESGLTRCRAFHLDVSWVKDSSMMLQQFRDIAKVFSRREAVNYRKLESDRETVEMLTEMERLARSLKLKGVKTEMFERMLQSLEQPVQMTVRPSGHLSFQDFGDIEIRLNPAEKAVYFLFLNHPEGILPDAVVGFRADLIDLYKRASIYDEWHSPENTVDSICAEDKNVLYSTISKIKSKFKVLGEKQFCHYIISKDSMTGKYRIPLDPSMVLWIGQSWIVK